tara:strand:- start:352 stop:582 length:231 start_codon:yes stop_codon:yes gene_type:complete
MLAALAPGDQDFVATSDNPRYNFELWFRTGHFCSPQITECQAIFWSNYLSASSSATARWGHSFRRSPATLTAAWTL